LKDAGRREGSAVDLEVAKNSAGERPGLIDAARPSCFIVHRTERPAQLSIGPPLPGQKSSEVVCRSSAISLRDEIEFKFSDAVLIDSGRGAALSAIAARVSFKPRQALLKLSIDLGEFG